MQSEAYTPQRLAWVNQGRALRGEGPVPKPAPRSEAEMRQVLDSYLAPFEVRREVTGRLRPAAAPHGKVMKPSVRIDYIVDARHLIRGGWPASLAYFGIEAKSEGSKFGPAFSQALDYRLFYDFGVPLDMVFCYPFTIGGGDLASISTHQRIGTINPPRSHYGRFDSWRGMTSLAMCHGQANVAHLLLPPSGTAKINVGRSADSFLEHGRKTGSR
jgi:hypothetical protein